MGLLSEWGESPEDRRRRHQREDYVWKQGLRDDTANARAQAREAKADARYSEREAKADARDAQRAMERAVAERNRRRESKERDAMRAEQDSFKVAIVKRTGGTRGVPVIKVNHHLVKSPILVLPPQNRKSPSPRVVEYLTERAKVVPSLARDPKFQDAVDAAKPLITETMRAYGSLLERLRDERWWDELSDSAGLTIDKDGGTRPWKGAYGSGFQPVKLRIAPTISGVRVASDGLRIRVAPRLGDTAKAWRAKQDMIRSAFKAAGAPANSLEVHEDSRGGIVLRFNDCDPFEHIDSVEHVFDTEKGRSLLGLTSTGQEAWVVWAGSSGMIVGGVPGSGKTASMLPVFASLADHAELHVFDGKASYDLHPLRHIAATYDRSGATDAPLEVLMEVFGLIERRADVLMRHFGISNFWNVPVEQREALGLFPIIIVLDEAQTWTNPEGMTADEKKLQPQVLRFMRENVLKGRSSGIFTVITTQQPDVKTVPSNLRNNAGRKLSFRVSTTEQAITILGALPEGAPSPTDIPQNAKGRAVMEADGQGVVLLQSGYVAPEVLEEQLASKKPVPRQADVVARLLGEAVPARRSEEPVTRAQSTPTVDEQAASPVALPEHIAAVIPSPEEAKAMTPEQRLEAMRLIAQLQGHIPADASPAPAPVVEEPAPAPVVEEPDVSKSPDPVQPAPAQPAKAPTPKPAKSPSTTPTTSTGFDL